MLEMTFIMKRSRDALLSVSEMRKSGQMPMANRTEVLTDNNGSGGKPCVLRIDFL